MDFESLAADIVNLMEAAVASPLTLAIASAVSFLLGLVLRPFIEAQSALFKERGSAQRGFQHATLIELRDALQVLGERSGTPESARAKASATIARLTPQVRDQRVRSAIGTWRFKQTGFGRRADARLGRRSDGLREARDAVGEALRRL